METNHSKGDILEMYRLSCRNISVYEQELRELTELIKPWDPCHGPASGAGKVASCTDIGSSLTTESMKPVGAEHFWAVVVGIDQYDDGATLSGCVNDAQIMVEFLIDELRVPPSRVIALTSSPLDEALERKIGSSRQPTRAAILDALHGHFRDNDEVECKDNMFFSFSGFGALYGTEDGSSRTEALCPMDRDVHSNSNSYVPDISDRELDVIFSEIRDSKGANLTVVLDCSYSPTSTAHMRSLPHMYDSAAQQRMLAAAESDPRRRSDSDTGLSLSSPSWKADTSSHVLFAACQPHETAMELVMFLRQNRTYGRLTHSFISMLNSPCGWSPSLTYNQLFGLIMRKARKQMFVANGDRLHSRLWFQEGPIPIRVMTVR